jgi:hypothetical protein
MTKVASRALCGLVVMAGALGACREDVSETADQDVLIQEAQRELDAATLSNPATAAQVGRVRPVLKCVGRLGNNRFQAHFGYRSGAPNAIAIPVSFFNRFWPAPTDRGQPTAFLPGSTDDVVQVSFSGFSSSIWVLGNHLAIATRFSRPCPGGAVGGAGGGAGGPAGGTGGAAGGAGGAGGTGGHLELCGIFVTCTDGVLSGLYGDQCRTFSGVCALGCLVASAGTIDTTIDPLQFAQTLCVSPDAGAAGADGAAGNGGTGGSTGTGGNT